MQESYQWIAEYDDGTLLAEEPGVGFKDIDQKRLKYFVLQPLDEKLPTVALYVSEDMRLIFFRRRAVIPDMEMQELEQTHKERTLTALGWQKTIHGKNVQFLTFYFPDGRIIHTDDYNAL